MAKRKATYSRREAEAFDKLLIAADGGGDVVLDQHDASFILSLIPANDALEAAANALHGIQTTSA